jgi:hypothetical protein
MPKQKRQDMVLNRESQPVTESVDDRNSSYRLEIIQIIDRYADIMKNRRIDKNILKSRLRLMHLKEVAYHSDNLPDLEKELWTMAVDIEEPGLRVQRNISVVIFAYTLSALLSFITLTVTDAIMLPSFNIPYSVLLMGLVGCLVSMFVKLPSIRTRETLTHNSIVWFIISPPVAVIMSGICFGIVQIFLPLMEIEVLDESWFFWILAWCIGFVNWVYLYEKLNGGFKRKTTKQKVTPSDKIQVVGAEEKGAP